MQSAPISRTTLVQTVFPVFGWASLCLGVVLIVVAFFPPPPTPHPIIDLIRAPAPVVTHLLLGIVLSVSGLSMIIRSKSARIPPSTLRPVEERVQTAESWTTLDSFDDLPTAEALVELLRSGGVPAKVEVNSPVPGLVEGVRVAVAQELIDRAKQINSQESVPQRELEYEATGKVADSEDANA